MAPLIAVTTQLHLSVDIPNLKRYLLLFDKILISGSLAAREIAYIVKARNEFDS